MRSRGTTQRRFAKAALRLSLIALVGSVIVGPASPAEAATPSLVVLGPTTLPGNSTSTTYESAARVTCPAPPAGQSVIVQMQYESGGTWLPYSESSQADAILTAPGYSRTIWLAPYYSASGPAPVTYRCAAGTGTGAALYAWQPTYTFEPVTIKSGATKDVPIEATSTSVTAGSTITYSDGGGFSGGQWTFIHFASQTHYSYTYTTLIDANIAQRSGRWGPQQVSVPINTKGGQLLTTVTATSPTMRVTAEAPAVKIDPAPVKNLQTLIALGDSYSSGEGNPPYVSSTDSAYDKCHRSPQAWPNLLGNLTSSGTKLVANLACSGATSLAMTKTFKSEVPQISGLKSYPASDIVTVTMGGNDIGFSYILTQCYVGSCAGSQLTTIAQLSLSTGSEQRRLEKVLQQIKAARPSARVILVGYPSIFSTTQSSLRRCTWLSKAERTELVELAGMLDKTQKNAVGNVPGTEYVSTLTSMKNHELCTADPWITPIAGSGTAQQAMGHPNALGQSQIVNAVSQHIN